MGKAPDPVVPPPPPIPLIVKVLEGGRALEGAEVIVKGKGKPKTTGANDLTGADGRADFGPADPRTKFDITVRKTGFGPPGTPVIPGDVILTRAAKKNGTVDVPMGKGPVVVPLITPNKVVVVLVKKPNTAPKRVKVNVKADVTFGGTGALRQVNPSGSVKIFKSATGNDERPFDGANEVPLTTAELEAGTDIFIEGATPTAKVNDLKLTLELRGGTKVIQPAVSITVTCVELTLDICQSRTSATTDPLPLSADDKFKKGRFVHKQVGTKHGRAMLIVRKAKPDDFADALVLNSTTVGGATRPKVFADTAEVPAAGQSALTLPLDVTGVTAAGKKFFVEGDGVSNALLDITLQLGVKGLDDDGDRVNVTVVQFTDLKADIPSTPANQVRNRSNGGASNSPVARHSLVLANGGTAAESDYDPDYTSNVPVVLIEGSVRDADKIILTAKVAPAAAKPHVSWSIVRDRRTDAPKGDNAKIIALPGNSDDPGLAQDGSDKLKATLTANAAGSFHILPFIDNNGNGTNEFDDATGKRIDREPYICMNLVLVRVQGVSNLTVVNSAARNPARPATATRNYFGTGNLTVPANFSSGDFRGTGNDAITMHVIAHLIGGGDDGKRGLDQVFGAWSNNELNCPTSPGPGNLGEDVTHTFRRRNPPPPAPANPQARTRSFWRLDGTETSGPMLDAGAFSRPNRGTGGNTCTSTNGRAPVEPAGTADPSGIGERREYQNPDSPGGGILLEHPNDTGVTPAVNRRTLRNFKFNIDFRCALLFWTNRDKVPGNVDKPACRLYSTVSTNSWTVRFESSFDDNFAATAVVAQTIALVKDANATRRATPVDASGLETRAPGGVDVLVVDVPF